MYPWGMSLPEPWEPLRYVTGRSFSFFFLNSFIISLIPSQIIESTIWYESCKRTNNYTGNILNQILSSRTSNQVFTPTDKSWHSDSPTWLAGSANLQVENANYFRPEVVYMFKKMPLPSEVGLASSCRSWRARLITLCTSATHVMHKASWHDNMKFRQLVLAVSKHPQ